MPGKGIASKTYFAEWNTFAERDQAADFDYALTGEIGKLPTRRQCAILIDTLGLCRGTLFLEEADDHLDLDRGGGFADEEDELEEAAAAADFFKRMVALLVCS
jgi:hypothetical protein